MSSIVNVESPAQYNQLISASTIVVTDYWATWCGPCRAIAPIYEKLAAELARPGKVTFTKVDTDAQKQIAASYNISAMPTFTVIKNGREISRVQGANPGKLNEMVKKIAAEADAMGPADEGSSSGGWKGADIPRGYTDITDQIDIRGLDMMNHDADKGSPRVLFETSKPVSIDGKGAAGSKVDWVESDTDEQLMLYVPFQAVLKIHTIHLTSLPPAADHDDSDSTMRPKSISLYINQAHNLGFEEASDMDPTQKIDLKPSDWDEKTGTAKVELRFVRFQKVSSLVVFVVDGEGSSDKVRLDRIRLVGDTGEKRSMGKLEKIGDEQGA